MINKKLFISLLIIFFIQSHGYAASIKDLSGTYVGTAFEDKSPCVITIGTLDLGPMFLPVQFAAYNSSSLDLSLLSTLDVISDSAHRLHLDGKSNDGKSDFNVVLWLTEDGTLKSATANISSANPDNWNSSICRNIIKK